MIFIEGINNNTYNRAFSQDLYHVSGGTFICSIILPNKNAASAT